MQKTIWKKVKIKNFSHYQISNDGNLLNTKNGYITCGHTCHKEKKYLQFSLYNNGQELNIMAHKLVLMHFKRKEIGKDYGIHLNLLMDDNRSENLKWATRSDVIRQAWKRRRKKESMGAYYFPLGGERPWRAMIKINTKLVTLKYCKTKKEAQEIYYTKYLELYREVPWI